MLAEDWPTYRELRLRALKEAPDAFGSTWEEEAAWPDERWSARALASERSPAGIGLLAVQQGQVCGLLWVLLAADEPNTANLYQMWVDPEVRRRGVGLTLLQEGMTWAKSRGVNRMVLTVAAGTSPAMALYRSQGFAPVGMPEQLREGDELMAQTMALSWCD